MREDFKDPLPLSRRLCLLPLSLPEKLCCLTGFFSLQTPLSWQELEGERASSCTHKRSASWGSTDHRKEVTVFFDFLTTAAASCLPQHHGCTCSKVDSHFHSHLPLPSLFLMR